LVGEAGALAWSSGLARAAGRGHRWARRMAQRRIPSLQGQLILDGGKLSGSVFQRSVVLVCQHDAQGALGLVLTETGEHVLDAALDVEVPEPLRDMPLGLGGPVQKTALSYLVTEPALLNPNVMPGLRLGHDVEELFDLGRPWIPGRKIRVFAGYAGWSPGQLDDEMLRESWLQHPASLDLVFDVPPEQLWRRVLKSRSRWQERILADAPIHLLDN